MVIQYCGSFFHVSNTIFGLILAVLAGERSPSSIDSRISPMPKRPITAIRKSKPAHQLVPAEDQPQLPGDGIDADRREREADHHRRHDLERRLLCPCR